jgi:branched-chain amino acid transport system substrate-binding protein
MRLRSTAVLFTVASILVLSACTSHSNGANPQQEVRIGLLGPLTGPSGSVGQQAAHGAELAALVINPGGSAPVPLAGRGLPGLGGARIRIVQADTRGDPQQAVRQAISLASQQRVAGIIGADSGGSTAEGSEGDSTASASERTERIGVPFVGAVATADFLTERGLEWFFRVAPTDSMFAQAGLDVLQQLRGRAVSKLGVLNARDNTSNEAATAFRRLAAQANDQVASGANFASGSSPEQVLPSLSTVRGANPDAVIGVATRQNDARALLAADRSGGARSVSLATGPGFTAQTIRQAASGADVLHTTAWSLDFAGRNPAAKAIADLYLQRFKSPMTDVAAETFTATLALAQAIDTAGSANPELVRTALLGLDVPGSDTIMPWGGIRFDQTGQNTLAAGLVEQVTPTAARVVFPPELTAGNNT